MKNQTITLSEAFAKATKGPLRFPEGDSINLLAGNEHDPEIVAVLEHNDFMGVQLLQESKHNAALLAHCFNHFQEVVSALESARELLMESDVRFKICDGGKGNMGEAAWWNRVAKQMREALNKSNQVTIQ